jgi:hypothetical protein
MNISLAQKSNLVPIFTPTYSKFRFNRKNTIPRIFRLSFLLCKCHYNVSCKLQCNVFRSSSYDHETELQK